MELLNKDCGEVFYKILNKYHDKNIVIVTDSPFNINYHYNNYNDNLDEDDYYEFMDFIFRDMPSVIIHYPESLYKISFQIEKFPQKVISWVYNSNTAKQHRDIAFFDVKPNMNQVKQPYKNPNDKRIKERIAKGCKGAKLYDWWNVNQVKNVSKQKTNHPCQMPLQVMENIIGILPYECLIIDPFMGSGTTGVAVQNMNIKQKEAKRDFVGIELDKEYFEIAKKRIENTKVQTNMFDLKGEDK